MRAITALLFLVAATPCQAIEISNFKSGLACTNTTLIEGRRGWVCQQTRDVLVTDQGRCVYNGEAKPCTWTAFEFDYESEEENTKLQCVGETSRPSSPGNPNEVLAHNVTSQPYEIELPGKAGHFFNPMYYVFAVRPVDDSVIVDSLTCSIDGAVLFEASFNLHFPTLAD